MGLLCDCRGTYFRGTSGELDSFNMADLNVVVCLVAGTKYVY